METKGHKLHIPFLDELKANVNLFLAFYNYVASQLCKEAIDFILEIELYRVCNRPTRTLKEIEIVNRYVKVGATEQINITMAVKEKIIAGLGKGDETLFDEAQIVCIKLLQGESWYEFHKTEEYKRAVESKQPKGKLMEKAIQKVVVSHVFSAAVWLFSGRKIEEENIDQDSEKTVVILGGGILGVLVAKRLHHKYKKKIRIIIVDKKQYFEFPEDCIPLFFQNNPQKIAQYKEQTAIPYDLLFYGLRIEIVQGEVLKVTPQKVMVSTVTLYYDALVVGTGCSFSLPPLPTARSLTWSRDVENISEFVHNANSIMIVGAGLPGVHMAVCAASIPDKEVTLVHSGKDLIPGLSQDADDKIRKYIKSKNNSIVLPNSTLSVIPPKTKNGKYVTQLIPSDPGQKIKKDHVKHTLAESPLFASYDTDAIIWCEKLIPNSTFMFRHFSSSISESKYIIINPTFQVAENGLSNVFAGGDVVCWKNERHDYKEISSAIKHAKIITQNIKALFLGKSMKTYKPTYERQRIISLGFDYAIVTENGKIIAEGENALKAKASFYQYVKNLILYSDTKSPINLPNRKIIKFPDINHKILILANSEPTIQLALMFLNNGIHVTVVTSEEFKKYFVIFNNFEIIICDDKNISESIFEGIEVIILSSPVSNFSLEKTTKLVNLIKTFEDIKYLVSIHPYGISAEIGYSVITKISMEFLKHIRECGKSVVIVRYSVILDLFLEKFFHIIQLNKNVSFPSFASTWPTKEDVLSSILLIISNIDNYLNQDITLAGSKRIHITSLVNCISTAVGDQIFLSSITKPMEWLELMIRVGYSEEEAETAHKWFFEDASRLDKPNNSMSQILQRDIQSIEDWCEKNAHNFV